MAATEEDLLSQLLAQQEEAKLAAHLERQKQLEALQSKRGTVDTTAAAAFIDSMYGTNALAGAESSAREAAKEQDLLQTLLKEERDAGSAAKGAPSLTALLNAKTKEKREGRQEEQFGLRRIDKFQADAQDRFEKEVLKPVQETQQQFKTMEAALASGDVQTIKMVLGQFARGISGEKGVLTDRDVARVFPETAAQKIAQMKAFITGNEEADPRIIEKAETLLEIAREAAARRYRDAAQLKAKQLKQRSAGKIGPNQEFVQDLEEGALGIINSFAPEKREAAPAATSGGLPSMDAIQAEMARRAAAAKGK